MVDKHNLLVYDWFILNITNFFKGGLNEQFARNSQNNKSTYDF